MASFFKGSAFLLFFFFFLFFALHGFGERDHLSLPNPTLFLSHHSFVPTYKDMEANLRVYIYPSQGNLTFPTPTSSGEAEDDDAAFYRRLAQSEYSVGSLEGVHLFYMPLSMLRDPSASPARNALKYVQAIRERFPFWQRTLGADHFLTSCLGLNRSSSRDVLELQKNAILLACSSLFTTSPNSEFYPHKDLAMPPRVKCPQRIPENLNLNSRQNLIASLGPDMISLPCSEIAPILASSRFCLTLITNPSLLLVDALRSGCVPVIASAGFLRSLPFQDILNWHQFAVVVSHRALPDLKSLLQNMPLERYQTLQQNGIAAAKYLEWNDPPQPYDAFHLLLYEVWIRRHVIRYVRREGM